ncbi:unnamed protein product [Pedinophyceae sp. YPF-701]|nr:unnamed protein product [Pedinophyceae sp. YPF-701]
MFSASSTPPAAAAAKRPAHGLMRVLTLLCVLAVGAAALSHATAAARGPAGAPAVLDRATAALRWWTRGNYEGSWAAEKARRIELIREENDWKNDLLLHDLLHLPRAWTEPLPRLARSWARNYVGVNLVYFAVGALWCYMCYFVWGRELYNKGERIPAWKDVWEQMKVSIIAMPGYALLPATSEWVVERGWTLVYPRVDNYGAPAFFAMFFFYMCCVEFWVYWMHRSLHWGFLYTQLHATHHKYNKEGTLSPFAGLAFHWLDGVIQAFPYCFMLLTVPVHFLSHELILFGTGVWTTNIHDCLHANVAPVMGAGYHAIHHITYRHNHGHYFTYMDRIFGTLYTPEEFGYHADDHKEAKTVKAE